MGATWQRVLALTGELTSNGDIEVTRFDPALGILNSVTLDLSAEFNYRTQFENRSNVSSTLAKNIDQRLTIGSGLLDTGIRRYSLDQTVSAFDGTVDYAGTSGFDVSASNGLTEEQLFFTGLDMADFVGPGTLFLAVASYADFTASFNGGNASFLNSQDFATRALVTYDYRPVPLRRLDAALNGEARRNPAEAGSLTLRSDAFSPEEAEPCETRQ